MHLNDAPGYGKPQAGATLLARNRIVGLLKLLKQLGLIGSGNARPRIPHRNLERAVVRCCFNHDFASIGELDGVADKRMIATRLAKLMHSTREVSVGPRYVGDGT